MSSYYKQRILSNIQQQVAQQKNLGRRDELTLNETDEDGNGNNGDGDDGIDDERDRHAVQMSLRKNAAISSQAPNMRTAVNKLSTLIEPPPNYAMGFPIYQYIQSASQIPVAPSIPPIPIHLAPPMPPSSPAPIPSHLTSSTGPPPLMQTTSNAIPGNDPITQQLQSPSQGPTMPQVQTYFIPSQTQAQSYPPAQAQAQAQARRAIPSMVNRTKQNVVAGGGTSNNGTAPGITANSLTTIEWNQALEQLLITWAEKANGHAWLHSRCINHYKQKSLWITVPAAVFGYLAGTTTLLGGESLNRQEWFRGIVGISAIVAGILSNLQQTFTYKELSEQHRIASLRFFAFFRDVSAELSLEYKHRANVLDYITLKRMELDKLYEQSPIIPQDIIDEFNDKFKTARYHKPDVALTLQTIVPYSKIITKINNESRFREQMKNNGTDEDNTTLSDRIQKEKHRDLLKEAFKRWRWYYLHNRQTRTETIEKEHGVLVEVANSDTGSLIHVPRGGGAICAADRNPPKRVNKASSISLFWGGKKKQPRLDETMRIPLKPLLKTPIPRPKMVHSQSPVSKPLNSPPSVPTLSNMMRSKTEQNREREQGRDNDNDLPSGIKPVRSYNSLPIVSNRHRGSLHDAAKDAVPNESTSYYTYGSGGESGREFQPTRDREKDKGNKEEDITQIQPQSHHRHHHRRHRQQNTVISNTVEITRATDTLPTELGNTV